MTTYPPLAAGQKLTAALLASMLEDEIVKSSTQTVTNSTTLVSDTELTVPVLANATYDIRFHIRYGGLNAAGFKTAWLVPSGTVGNKWVKGPGSANATEANANTTEMRWSIHGPTTQVGYSEPRNSTGLQTFVEEGGRFEVGSTAGSITLQYAQLVANATGTQVVSPSHVRWRRIG